MGKQQQIAHFEGEEAFQPDILLAEQKDETIFNTQLVEPVKELLPTSGILNLSLEYYSHLANSLGKAQGMDNDVVVVRVQCLFRL